MKEEKTMSISELRETRVKAAYLELGRMNYDDPNRKKVLDEIEVYSRVDNAYEQTEQKRLDNYVKNELEERRIRVEEAKVKNDKQRNGTDVFKAILFCVGGFLSGFSGYMFDTWFQKDKTMGRLQDKLQDLIVKK